MSVKEWQGFQYEIQGGGLSYYGSKKGVIRRRGGRWPADTDLITLMDGDEPPHAHHFGGVVKEIDAKHKHVTVYTD